MDININGLPESNGLNSNQETNLLNVEKIVKENPVIELGSDVNYNQITQSLDYGQMYYYDRTPILTEKSFADIEKIVLTDAQVIASLDRKRLSVLQLGWTIQSADDSEESKLLRNFIDYCLLAMEGTIEDALFQLYSSIVFGYSLSEINFKWCNNTDYKGKLVLKNIKNKNTGVYQFNLDTFGNILGITNLYNVGQPLPKDKFIWLSWKPRYSNPYGYGLADTLYYLCYAKKQLMKNSLIGAGKWANPSLYIQTGPQPSTEEIAAAKQFAFDIQNSSAGALPEPLKAQLLELANRSQNPNLEIIKFINDEIAKCINLSSAGTTSNEGQSSYASKQIELTSSLIDENYMIKLSEDLINEKIIKLLCGINFDKKIYSEDLYPYFRFNPTTSENKSALVDRIEKLYNMGFVNSSDDQDYKFVRSIDELPEQEDYNENEPNNRVVNSELGAVNKNDNADNNNSSNMSKDENLYNMDKIEVLDYSEYKE